MGLKREAHRESEWTLGRSAVPQSWETLGRVDRTQMLVLWRERGLGEDPVLSSKPSVGPPLTTF